LDYLQRPFDVGLFSSLSEDASAAATYNIECTPDNPNQTKGTRNPVASLSRTTTVVTLTWANPHGLVTGDALKVYNSGDPNLDGDQQVASTPSPTSITYAVANTGAVVGSPYTEAIALRVFALPTALTAATTRQSASLTIPAWAVRLRATALTAGSIVLEVVQGYGRG
jgi:hypothetical protein